MAEARWREISSRLTRIGLFPVKGVQASLLAEKDPDGLIDKAQEFGYTGVLTEELLVELKLRTEAKAAPEPAQVEPTGETVGRVIAPISQTEPTPADRPHGLPHFSLDGFPMLATDVDTELDIHFDITGKSTTEGKMADFLSLFNNRLEKLKRIIVQTGRLPNRVISVNQLIRDKSRYTL